MECQGNKYFIQASTSFGTDASEKYLIAANEYLAYEQKSLAGLCYCSAADTFLQCKQKRQAVTYYIKAYEMYQNVNNHELIIVLQKLVTCLAGKPELLGKYYGLLGKFNRIEGRMLEAISAFEKAVQYYFKCGCINEATEAVNNATIIMIKDGSYQKALLYVNGIDYKYQIKETMFQAGLLRLCLKGTEECSKLLSYEPSYMLYHGYMFLTDLINAIKDRQRNKIIRLVDEYHKIHPLTSWQVKLLKQIQF